MTFHVLRSVRDGVVIVLAGISIAPFVLLALVIPACCTLMGGE